LEVRDTFTQADMDTAAARRMIVDIVAVGRPILVFSGGEPLLRGDIYDLAAFAREQGLPTAVASNGTLLDEEAAVRLRGAGVGRVSFSLDGASAPAHDRLRGPGNFEKTIRNVSFLKAEGLGFQINTTVTRRNAQELPALHDLAVRLGAKALHLFMLVPVGCGAQIADGEMLSSEETETWLSWLHDRASERRLELKATCAPQYTRISRQKSKRPGSPPGSPEPPVSRGCLAGVGVCFVSHRGDVFPCGYLPLRAGNVRTQPFREIWESSPVFQKLRDPEFLEGKCGACSFKVLCGGCRARAYYQHGSELGEEPTCAHVPPARAPRTNGPVPRRRSSSK